MHNFRLSEFIVDEINNVHISPTAKSIDYSDGDEIEQRLYECLKSINDLSIFSNELISHICDWPTEYHFSPVRHNLLRHYEFSSKDVILELGCGCGAITRQLGESGASVTSIEGSYNRARCAAERCRDLNNVEIYCSDFQNITFEQEYDYVTLIGVMEYATIFFKEEDPFLACLKIVRSALKPEGKLIIAIENRLGLKYFNGLVEDHVGVPFFGLQDLYTSKTAKTLGKAELTQLLERAGFASLEFQYPFPDYKIPSVILKEEGVRNAAFKCDELIRHLKYRDYTGQEKPLFSDFMVWPVLHKNGLLTDMSNSFLVEASPGELHPKDETTLAIKYTSDRKNCYNTKTEFKVEAGQIRVTKSPLTADVCSDILLNQVLSKDKYVLGDSLESRIKHSIYLDNFVEFLQLIADWIKFLEANALSVNNEDKFCINLLPEYIDCLPSNLISAVDGTIHYIDKEWVYKEGFSIRFLLLKFWQNVLQFYPSFFKKHLAESENLFYSFARTVGVPYTQEEYIFNYQLIENLSTIVYMEERCKNSELNKPVPKGFYLNKRLLTRVKNVIKRVVNK